MSKRVALVTGASRGIGAAIVKRLQELDMMVLKPSRQDLDLLSNESIDNYFAKLSESIDVLVNNAGINLLGRTVELLDNDIENMIQVNLTSPMRLISKIAPLMIKRNYGRIVNISSIWSIVSKPERVVYCSSKAGLNGLTRAVAVELAPYNVLVNSVAPGFVNTELTRQNNCPVEMKKIQQNIPLQRLAEPEEIAEFVGFLCSEKNTYLTGQTIFLDGGFTCM